MIIWRTRDGCSIPKATNTRSESVILMDFPLQQWLHERASVLRYTCIACLVFFLYLRVSSINILCTFLTFTVSTACFAHLIFLFDHCKKARQRSRHRPMLRGGCPRNRGLVSGRATDFLSTVSGPDLRPTQSAIQWVLEVSVGIKRLGREADHLRSSSAKLKNEGVIRHSSKRLYIVHKNNFAVNNKYCANGTNCETHHAVCWNIMLLCAMFKYFLAVFSHTICSPSVGLDLCVCWCELIVRAFWAFLKSRHSHLLMKHPALRRILMNVIVCSPTPYRSCPRPCATWCVFTVKSFLDFRLSPWFEYWKCSFGYFPGVKL